MPLQFLSLMAKLMKKQLNVQDSDEEFDLSAAHGNPNEEFIRVVEGINEIESLQSRNDTKYRALVVHGLNTKMLYRSASLRPSHRVPWHTASRALTAPVVPLRCSAGTAAHVLPALPRADTGASRQRRKQSPVEAGRCLLGCGAGARTCSTNESTLLVVARWMAIFDSDTDAVDNFYEPNSVMRCVRA